MGTFSERLRKSRENVGMTQKEVASVLAYLKVTSKKMSDYETGKTNPDPEVIKQLAILYGVSSDYLLGIIDFRNVVAMGGNAFAGLSDESKKILL